MHEDSSWAFHIIWFHTVVSIKGTEARNVAATAEEMAKEFLAKYEKQAYDRVLFLSQETDRQDRPTDHLASLTLNHVCQHGTDRRYEGLTQTLRATQNELKDYMVRTVGCASSHISPSLYFLSLPPPPVLWVSQAGRVRGSN